MSAPRRIQAVYTGALPVRDEVPGPAGDGEAACGLVLAFRASRTRAGLEPLADFVDLGPELTVAAALGLGRVLRLLRVARRAAPSRPEAWLGHPEAAARHLAPAAGTPVLLEVRRRSRLRFRAWTEHEAIVVDDVADVVSEPSAFLVRRLGARAPLRVPRDAVVRQQTEQLRWLQVVDIERP